MVKKRGRPPKVKRGRPKGSKNKIITGLKEALQVTKGKIPPYDVKTWRILNVKRRDNIPLEYVKDYPETASFRSRLEASVIKFEQAVNETIEQLKGKI